MGYNIYKRANDERLQCVGKKKINTKTQENLEHNESVVCCFLASIMGEIANEMSNIDSRYKTQNETFYLKTHDNVDELKEGDFIYIKNFDRDFLIVEKYTNINVRNTKYMKLDKMNKTTRFYVRGKE